MLQNPPSSLLPRLIAALLILTGAALLATQSRVLYQQLTTLPTAPAQTPPSHTDKVSPQLLQRLFTPTGPVIVASLEGVTLQGCIVATEAVQSQAVFHIAGQAPVTAFIGEEFVPGIRLEQIAADHVTYNQAGSSGRLDLVSARGSAPSAVPGSAG